MQSHEIQAQLRVSDTYERKENAREDTSRKKTLAFVPMGGCVTNCLDR